MLERSLQHERFAVDRNRQVPGGSEARPQACALEPEAVAGAELAGEENSAASGRPSHFEPGRSRGSVRSSRARPPPQPASPSHVSAPGPAWRGCSARRAGRPPGAGRRSPGRVRSGARTGLPPPRVRCLRRSQPRRRPRRPLQSSSRPFCCRAPVAVGVLAGGVCRGAFGAAPASCGTSRASGRTCSLTGLAGSARGGGAGSPTAVASSSSQLSSGRCRVASYHSGPPSPAGDQPSFSRAATSWSCRSRAAVDGSVVRLLSRKGFDSAITLPFSSSA